VGRANLFISTPGTEEMEVTPKSQAWRTLARDKYYWRGGKKNKKRGEGPESKSKGMGEYRGVWNVDWRPS